MIITNISSYHVIYFTRILLSPFSSHRHRSLLYLLLHTEKYHSVAKIINYLFFKNNNLLSFLYVTVIFNKEYFQLKYIYLLKRYKRSLLH